MKLRKRSQGPVNQVEGEHEMLNYQSLRKRPVVKEEDKVSGYFVSADELIPEYADENTGETTWFAENSKHEYKDENQQTEDACKQFVCLSCGRRYKGPNSLQRHQKVECGRAPAFQCPYCVYRAMHKSHLNRHMKRVHT
uniref:Longitudinals lacking protein, isoforms A/B/D/L n=2 Tax=Cacopsylla melanoneura TaxID=428564 RepID=A0A8D8Z580_9HEMI